MCKNVQKSYYGPCKVNRSKSGRRFQRIYYEKTLVGPGWYTLGSGSISSISGSTRGRARLYNDVLREGANCASSPSSPLVQLLDRLAAVETALARV